MKSAIAPKPLLLFDFDGTIADSRPLSLSIANVLAEKFGFPAVTPERLAATRQLGMREKLREWGIPLSRVPLFYREFMPLYREGVGEIAPYEGIPETLENLAAEGYGLAILSSNAPELISRFLDRHSIGQFSHIRSPGNLFGKHRAIRALLRDTRTTREYALYVGDEVRDIEACRKARVAMLGVAWGFDDGPMLQEKGAVALAITPADLLPLIRAHFESL
jgi:phosphoglycolate phosphatase